MDSPEPKGSPRLRTFRGHFEGSRLGFIQLKLNPVYRLHFYTPRLAAIVSDEDVHNHRYGFTSKILHGHILQDIVRILPGDTHIREFESCQEGVKAEGEPTLCRVQLLSRHEYWSGAEYSLRHDEFHAVKANNCVTLLLRGVYQKPAAEVVRPVGSEKVCPFSKKIAEADLWEMVDEMIDYWADDKN